VLGRQAIDIGATHEKAAVAARAQQEDPDPARLHPVGIERDQLTAAATADLHHRPVVPATGHDHPQRPRTGG